MIRVLTVADIKQLIHKVTLRRFFLELIEQLKSDFSRWQEFDKSPRHATHYADGVIELMPISDGTYYAFKYVTGHPGNTLQRQQTVVATGQLSSALSGYPLLISEMTILTALRTAATSALASQYLAKKDAKTFGIIGTGAQSEFQTLAHHIALGVEKIFYFDTDPQAMEKFADNLCSFGIELIACKDGRAVAMQSDIVTTATAQRGHHKILRADWLHSGQHLNKIGGDCPGKTELEADLLYKTKIVVEFLEQTEVEGEIQQLKKDFSHPIYAELWEIVSGLKKGRELSGEITLFDSVGFALEDYSVLRLVHKLADELHIGHLLEMIPNIPDPKNLFGALR